MTDSVVEQQPKAYSEWSWLDPRLEVKQSVIHGKGLFAKKPFFKGETVIVWGGTLMTDEDIIGNRHRPRSAAEIGEGLYLAGEANDPEEDPDENLNHSCDSNLWMIDEVTLVARRDIPKNEELTVDYAMWLSRPDWKIKCNCGSNNCRHLITGNDWKRKDLQEKYKGHFSPYLNKRIGQSQSDQV